MKVFFFFFLLISSQIAGSMHLRAPAPSDTTHTAADSLVQRGISLYSESRYTEAINVLREANAGTASAVGRFYLGLSFAGMNEFRSSAEQISAALVLDSLNAGYRFRLAAVLTQAGEVLMAQEQYEILVNRDPSFIPAQFNLAVLLQDQREFKRSAELFVNVILKRPTDFLAFYNLGVSMNALDKPDSARVCFATSMTLNPSYVPAIMNLASFHYDRKTFDEALRLFRIALRLRPRSADIVYRIALCYQQLQNWEAAKEHFRAASELNPSRSEYVAQLGYVFFFTRQFDSCAIAYRKAIVVDSLNSYYHLNLALAYASLDSTSLAVREFQTAIDLRHPEDLAKVYNQLAGVCFRTGQFAKAISVYEKAVVSDPQNRESRFYLSISYDRVKDARSAKQSFEHFLTISPKDTSQSAWKTYARKRIRDIDRKAAKR